MSAGLFERIQKIRAFVFSVDGVLTDGKMLLLDNGEWLRQMHVKDGFAIRTAVDKRFMIGIISGGDSDAIRIRMEALGVRDIFMDVETKQGSFERFLIEHSMDVSEVLYMGDDIPDLQPMRVAGVAACPQDAAPEVKKISHYIAEANGGQGCAREVIELVLKAQGEWTF